MTGSSATATPRLGIFNDGALLESLGYSAFVAVWVTILSLFVGTCNAFLFERTNFPGKNMLYVLALTPLVIPRCYSWYFDPHLCQFHRQWH